MENVKIHFLQKVLAFVSSFKIYQKISIRCIQIAKIYSYVLFIMNTVTHLVHSTNKLGQHLVMGDPFKEEIMYIEQTRLF